MISIEQIIKCYTGLGIKSNLNTQFDFYPASNWINPVMSPYFVKEPLSDAEIDCFQSLLASQNSSSPVNATIPYINTFNGDGLWDQSLLVKALKESGWVEDSAEPLNYMIWCKPYSIQIPKGFYIESSRYGDDPIHLHEYYEALKIIFNLDDNFCKYLKLIYQQQAQNIHIVIIKTEEEKNLAGISLLCMGDQAALLSSGGIIPEYRELGLWRVLIAVRQEISAKLGARFWVSTSSKNKIKDKGDIVVPSKIMYFPNK